MTSLDASSSSNLGRLLRQTREELWRHMSAELAAVGIEMNFSQYIVMKNLRNGPAMSSSLADCAAINAGAMTRVIDSLIEQGLVTRTPSEQDRRVMHVDLTAQGRKIAKQMEVCGLRTLECAFADISDRRLSELFHTLETIVGNLQSSNEPQ
ncbi:MarR family transcriptional regulator [Luteimonas sp. FXH3W]|uniref:MarR family transcriptional regulator n=1 Tax=Aquilutibacter rugosus TaxID=3115820 RepID=A0ABU7UZ96_9GAMM